MDDSPRNDARRRLEEIGRGFQDAAVLDAAAETGVLSALAEAATTPEVLAAELELLPRPLGFLLEALRFMGIVVDAPGGAFELADEFRAALHPGPDSAVHGLRAFNRLAPAWAGLASKLRTGAPREDGAGVTETLQCGMAARGRDAALATARAAPPPRTGRLVDLGGGMGALTRAYLEAWPDLTATLVDRPKILGLAGQYLGEHGLSARVELLDADFTQSDFGSGYVLALLSNVLHLYDESTCRRLLRRVHEALAPGGRCIVKTVALDADRRGPRVAVFFALNAAVSSDPGQAWQVEEIAAWMRDAGFSEPALVPLPGHAGVVLLVADRAE